MAMMEEAMKAGMTGQAVCAVVGISERRLREWRRRARQGDYSRHAKPAHVRPVNALTPQEQAAIERAVGCAQWSDKTNQMEMVGEPVGRYIPRKLGSQFLDG